MVVLYQQHSHMIVLLRQFWVFWYSAKDFDVIHVKYQKEFSYLRNFSSLETISSLGRKHGLSFIFISIFFLLLGYIIGGILIEINREFNHNFVYIHTEYIYAILYGASFYTALVTLVKILSLRDVEYLNFLLCL